MTLKENQQLLSLFKFIIISISILIIISISFYVILNYLGVEKGIFLSAPSLVFIFGSVIPISLVFYLTPITKTIYDKIQFSLWKETVLVSGLNGSLIGWTVMSIYGDWSNLSNPDVLEHMWAGMSASLITLLYAFVWVLLFIDLIKKDSNVEPDNHCFKEIDIKKSINYRFIGGIIIWCGMYVGVWSYIVPDLYPLTDFLKLPALIGLLLIFLITGLHIGNINFVQTIKILFYDIYGNYNIKDASLFIKTVKDLIIKCSFILFFCFLIVGLSNNILLVKTLQVFGNLGLVLSFLLSLYQLILIQDALVLQNSIVNKKFNEYNYQNNASTLYALISVFVGVMMSIWLLGVITL
tara:strand:- start:281 stop:1336 length:1056 start_codon:yes stop_codon:yes gene_type:complete